MGTRTKNQIVLKKQKCGGFLFKIFEPKMSIRSTNLALAGNECIALIQNFEPMETLTKSQQIASRIYECIENDTIKTEEQVQIFELLAKYLGLKTITEYATDNKISYNATKKRINTEKLKVICIFGTTLIIDNE